MSRNHLTSIFRQATGTTVARYILYKRMTIARKELAMGLRRLRLHPEPALEIIPAFSEPIGRCSAALLPIRRRWNFPIWIRAEIFRQFPNGAFMPSLYNLYTSVFTFNTIF